MDTSLPRETDAIVFDLDGTLWDTCETCAIGWNRVLDRHAIRFRPITADDVRGVAGKPHEQCIRETFGGVPEPQILTLIAETQLEDNRLVAEQGGVLYPHVEAGVRRLSARYPLFIVSNCQAGYIETFLAWSKLGPSFRDFECWGNTGRTKAENLGLLIARNGLRRALLVGDTAGDQAAARECGVPFVFVDYGFGVCRDADRSFSSFADLTSWLLADLRA
ncbi:MAG: HAD family hydrolase [Candidatus Rokuibacteriota bacterium]|nr:MAG: HAD family hydrolase [Candidatus Rokubacteria bacterium]